MTPTREQVLVEAIETVLVEGGVTFETGLFAESILDAALAVCRPVPCAECDQTGMTFSGAYEYDGGKLYGPPDCPTCHGSGSVPGPSSLLMVRGEQYGWVAPDFSGVRSIAYPEHVPHNWIPVFVDAGVSVPTPATTDPPSEADLERLRNRPRGEPKLRRPLGEPIPIIDSVPTPEPVCTTCGGLIAYDTTHGVWDHKNPADRAGVGYGHDPVPTPKEGA